MKNIGIGVNVFIFKEGRILLGKRKGTGEGQWGLPGGKLEFGESWAKCAIREVLEETGIQLERLEFVNSTNDPRLDRGEHYIHINFSADTEQDAQLIEPEKFSEWAWFDLDRLPQPIFFGHEKLMEAFKNRKIISD